MLRAFGLWKNGKFVFEFGIPFRIKADLLKNYFFKKKRVLLSKILEKADMWSYQNRKYAELYFLSLLIYRSNLSRAEGICVDEKSSKNSRTVIRLYIYILRFYVYKRSKVLILDSRKHISGVTKGVRWCDCIALKRDLAFLKRI